MGAHGSIGKSLTYQKRGDATLIRKKPIPKQPNTTPQLWQRSQYQHFANLWHSLSDAHKEVWRARGTPLRLSAFNMWMRANLNMLPDLLAQWHFDELTGFIAKDTAKLQNHGTIFGASHVPGLFNYCLSFDGLDDLANMGTPASLQLGMKSFSLIAHVKTLDARAGRGLISAATVWPRWELRLLGGKAQTLIGTNPVNVVLLQGTSFVNDDQWHKIETTLHRTTVGTLIVDGEVEDQQDITGIGNMDTINPITIGALDPTHSFLKGLIDEPQMYLTTWTPAAAKYRYEGGMP